ncbi:MAG: hypothetical protein WCC12_13755 [Anaerolineales bacterium]
MSKASDQNLSLDMLSKELDRSYVSLNNHYSLLVQLLVVATTFIGGLIIYVYSSTPSPQAAAVPPVISSAIDTDSGLRNVLIFVAPMAVLALFGAAVILLYQMGFFIYHVRDLSDAIKTRFNADFTLYYDTYSFPSDVQSFRRGDPTYNFLRGGLFLMPTLLFLGLVGLSFTILYASNHGLGTLFALLYAFGLIYLGVGLTGASLDLPKLHERYRNRKDLSAKDALRELNKHSQSRILRVILPRPIDFLSKGFLLFGGVVAALLEHKIPCLIQGNCAADLRQVIFSAPYPPNHTALFCYLLAWFVIQEVFVQQAKYLWNDIRDHNANKLIPANRQRPLAASPINSGAYWEVLIRWGLGLFLASLLSINLFIITIVISLLQVVYEFWAKPYSAKYPLGTLFIVGAGFLVRFLSGAYAVGWELADLKLWIYSLLMFSLGVTAAAIMWKTEAEYVTARGESLPRGQSAYFQRKGRTWLIAGWFYAALVLGGFGRVSGLSPNATGLNALHSYSVFAAICLEILLAVLLYGLAFGAAEVAVRLTGKIRNALFRKIVVGLLILSGGVLLLEVSIRSWPANVIVVVFGSAICLSFIQYWSISYEEYSLMYLSRNSSILLKAIAYYVFSADSRIKLSHLLWMVGHLNSPDFEKTISAYRTGEDG